MFIRQMKMRIRTAGLVYERVGGKYPKLMRRLMWIWGPPVYTMGYLHGRIKETFKRSK